MDGDSQWNVDQFGVPLGEYRGGVRRVIYGIIGSALFMFGLLVCLSGFVNRAANNLFATLASNALPAGSSVALLILLGMLFMLGGVRLLWRVINSLGVRIQLYDGGFSARLGGITTVAAWSEVATIFRQVYRQRLLGVPVWTSEEYRLTLASGEKLVFGDTISNMQEMGEHMQRQIAQALTPRAIASIGRGAELPFGKWRVSAAGIANGSETLPWSEVSGVLLTDDTISILRQGKSFPWSWRWRSATPNVYILIALVDALRQGGEPPHTPLPA